MRIILTGGAGFVGSHVLELLASKGHEVEVIDNLSFGKEDNARPARRLHKIDIGRAPYEDILKVFQDFEPHALVHLAAIHFIPYCMANPLETFETNVRGTNCVVQAAMSCGVTNFVYSSTMDVYPATNVLHSEEDKPEPCNVYGLSKLVGENYFKFASTMNENATSVSLRFANVYGPRETNPHLIPETIERYLSKEQEVIKMGYLGATRDFVHVSDLAEAVYFALCESKTGYEVFNVGSGVNTSVRGVVELIRQFLSDDRCFVEDSQKFRKFDRESLSPDISRIQRELGWMPRTDIVTGLKQLVKWYQDNM